MVFPGTEKWFQPEAHDIKKKIYQISAMEHMPLPEHIVADRNPGSNPGNKNFGSASVIPSIK